MRWPSASTTSVTALLAVMRVRAGAGSMSQRVDHDVDADRVAVRREAVEVFLALALALPGVGDVGVVRHDDHQPTALVGDGAEVGVRAVGAALGDATAAAHP